MANFGQRSPHLSEVAYDEIKQRILRLEFRPGRFLTESEICKILGVGRTPVHQALHRLMGEGLLDIIPRKGILIRSDSLNEILNLLEARLTIEPTVAALAAERASITQVRALRAIIDRQSSGTRGERRIASMGIDHEFHETLADAADNPILATISRSLHEKSGRLWQLQLQITDDVEQTNTEHEAICQAVEQADQAGASRAMQMHLTSLKRRRLPQIDRDLR